MWFYYLLSIYLAPLYYHFGHYPKFLDFACSVQEITETFGFYILAFIFIGILIFNRNYLFQTFTRLFSRNHAENSNHPSLLTKIDNVFKKFKSSGSILIDKIASYFKNKNKK